MGMFVLAIPAFADGAIVPADYTCDGAGQSPAVEWSGVPDGTRSLALIMEDPDVPKALRHDGLFVHWVLYGIPLEAKGIPEGGSAGMHGKNSAGAAGWYPPCPPRQYEPSEHRYIFTLYALDAELEFAVPPDKKTFMNAMVGHVLGETQYTGRYRRP